LHKNRINFVKDWLKIGTMHKILVIDDAEEVVVSVEAALSSASTSLDAAYTVKEALAKAQAYLYDLIIIDITLPDGDGFDLLLKIRNLEGYAQTPVIFLTGREDVSSVVSAFSLGAEDYIVKPFHLLELRARVERRLIHKESKVNSSSEDQIIAGQLMISPQSQRVKLKGKADFIPLTAREFKILLLLVKSPDHVFSRKQILDKVWGSEITVTDRTVDAHICYLRKKLLQFSGSIESVSGEGYRFNPNFS
jgi:DNA-binding response OmpR family regulator